MNLKKLIYQPFNTVVAQKSQLGDIEMNSENEEIVFDEKFELQIRTDLSFAKKIFERASAEVDNFSH